MNEIISISITDGTVIEPVTLQEAKAWIRVDGTDDDLIIALLITQARMAVESYTCCSLVSKDIECIANVDSLFELPHGPIDGTVKINDEDAEPSATTGTDFIKIVGVRGKVKLNYSVGYDPIPEQLKVAVLNEIAYRYQNRGDQVKEITLGSNYLCESSIHLCQPFKRMSWL